MDHAVCLGLTGCWVKSLLNLPFDYSEAFDRALKEVVATLPNRPAKETGEDVVGLFSRANSSVFRC